MSGAQISNRSELAPGVTWGDAGAAFVLFSENAEAVELCLFDASGEREIARLPLQRHGDLWHSHLEGVRTGQRYGYRVHGPYDPARGHRFNPNKLLIDPYARVLDRPLNLSSRHFGYSLDQPDMPDTSDSASCTPKCVLVHELPAVSHPHRLVRDLVIYELHVKGISIRCEDVPEQFRGTLAGLGSDAILKHLKELGATAVELLPVHPIADEPRLVRSGLRNYWGYNSVNFFALEPRYAAGDPISEFRSFVAQFHDSGIEVFLDVVFNHSGEGDESGPTLSFRGIDNAAYYRLIPGNMSRYENDSGCGNVLNVGHPRVRRMMLDSLRYWARAGVDGFRFDLATVLGKQNGMFDPNAAFFNELRTDRDLEGVKLIAEPWDATAAGYHLGGIPPGFSEWNDKFRDCARRFWRGDQGLVPEMATRLMGSSDIFAGRGPLASINFVTAHDGFTLEDLVSYATRHNWANGEQNSDGAAENHSWNGGAEGATADASIRSLRDRQKRNLIATLMLSLGVPMIAAGDELGRTQNGNNNAYCQDNEISWIDWSLDSGKQNLLRFFRRVIALRSEHACFRRSVFYRGAPEGGQSWKDITWLSPDGREMAAQQWQEPANAFLASTFATGNGPRYFLALNAASKQVKLTLPEAPGRWWNVLLDTSHPEGGKPVDGVATYWMMEPRSLLLLIQE